MKPGAKNFPYYQLTDINLLRGIFDSLISNQPNAWEWVWYGWIEVDRRRWKKMLPASVDISQKPTSMISPEAMRWSEFCDGNHGEPMCSKKDCWLTGWAEYLETLK